MEQIEKPTRTARKFTAKKLSLLILILLALISTGYIYTQVSKNNIFQGQANYNSIVPGKSTEEDVVDKFGDPANKSTNYSQTTLDYNSNNPNFRNQFLVNNNKVDFIKQIVATKDNIHVKDITEKYGTPRYILYGPGSVGGFDLYVYPDKGIAFIGELDSGIILEIWYFKATTISDFVSKWAPEYSYTQQPQQ